MNTMKKGAAGKHISAIALAGFIALMSTPVQAQDRIRAIAVFPPSEITTEAYREYIDLVNERGEGIVQIDFVGGPEVIPGIQQLEAVGRGTIDMTYSPASYGMGSMSEASALVGATVLPQTVRENGGFELLQEIFQERLGVHLLGRLAPATNFHLFLTQEPRWTEDGKIDLSGLRLRSGPLFNAFFEDQGAVPIVVPVPDIYTGLERGTFDGLGYSISAVKGFSWERFLNYRIDPGFFQADLIIAINPRKWNSLSEEARHILTEVSAEYEQISYDRFQALSDQVKQELENEDGVQTIVLEDAAATAFLDSAYGASWARLKDSGSPYYDELRAVLYDR
jgi:TRAP-type C4-dicarboxylate transport system substrate-binding protein